MYSVADPPYEGIRSWTSRFVMGGTVEDKKMLILRGPLLRKESPLGVIGVIKEGKFVTHWIIILK